MKKTTIYGIVLLVLVAIAGIVLLQDKIGASDEKKQFKVEDVEDISKIELKDRTGQQITLTKEKEGWRLNDIYPAREAYIELLLEALCCLEIKAPVSSSGVDNVVKSMIGSAVTTSIYTDDETPERVILVGAPAPGNDASYMVLQLDDETTSMPYEVFLPGFRGSLTGRFYVDETAWRSRTLLAYSPEEITSISVDFVEEPTASFTLFNKNNSFSLSTPNGEYTNEQILQSTTTDYLLKYELVGVDDYELQSPDTVVQMGLKMPYASMEIIDNQEKKTIIDIYRMPAYSEGNITYDKNGDLVEDTDRYYAIANKNGIVFPIQKYVFDPLLKKGEYFIQ